MTDWLELRKAVEDKIQQAEDAEKAAKRGDPEFLGYPPDESYRMSLKAAVGDCNYALGLNPLPHLRRWFFETREYAKELLQCPISTTRT